MVRIIRLLLEAATPTIIVELVDTTTKIGSPDWVQITVSISCIFLASWMSHASTMKQLKKQKEIQDTTRRIERREEIYRELSANIFLTERLTRGKVHFGPNDRCGEYIDFTPFNPLYEYLIKSRHLFFIDASPEVKYFVSRLLESLNELETNVDNAYLSPNGGGSKMREVISGNREAIQNILNEINGQIESELHITANRFKVTPPPVATQSNHHHKRGSNRK